MYDLRTEAERAAEPDHLPPGTRQVAVDVLGVHVPTHPSRLMRLFDDPAAAAADLGDGGSEALWRAQYADFVRLPHARAAFGRLFRDVAETANRPALLHCSTGKDRTGWAAAALLLLLGVPEATVVADYLASRDHLAPLVGPLLERFAARGGDPALLEPMLGVRPAYLETALAEVDRRFGSIAAYFADGLGVGAAVQTALRAAFVEAA